MWVGDFWEAAGLCLGWGLASALGFELSRALRGEGIHRFLSAACVAVTALLATQMLLLLCGLYTRTGLLAALVALLLVAWAWQRSGSMPATPSRVGSPEPPIRPAPALRVSANALRSSANVLRTTANALRATVGALLVWLGLCGAVWTALPARGDALAYHAPMAVQWIQQGSLWATDARVWFYPGNAELLLASNLVMAGTDALAGSVDAMLLGLLALAVAGVARRAGHDAITAWACGLALAATPLAVRSLGAMDSDLLLAVGCVWVLYFAWSAAVPGDGAQESGDSAREPAQGAAQARALCFIGLGVMAGTKYMGVAYATLLAVAGLALAGGSLWRGRSAWLGISIGLLLCLPFYLRNAWLVDNPVYPIAWGLGAWQLPAGDTSQLVATANPIRPQELAASALLTHPDWRTALAHAGGWLLPLALPCLALGALLLLSPRRALAHPSRWFVLAALGCWLLFGLTPLSAENVPGTLNQIASGQAWRFGLPALVLTALAGAVATTRGAWLRGLSQAAIAGCAVWWASEGQLVGAGLMVSGLLCWWVPEASWGRAWLWWQRGSAARARLDAWPGGGVLASALAASLVLGAALGVSAADQRVQREQLASFAGRSGVVHWLDGQPCAGTVAVTVGTRAQRFHRPDWERRVVAIGMNPVTGSDWRARLEHPDVDFVVVTRELGDPASPSFGEFPPLDRWLSVRPERFARVYSDGLARVYAPESGSCAGAEG